jgi:methylated-DNA-[protein]-cysteine S-methyltransferase
MSANISITYYKSPVGELILGSYQGKLCLADWHYRKMRKRIDLRIQQSLDANYIENDTTILRETIKQFEEYFKGERKDFGIPIELVGTDFQKNVWSKLLEIPYGKTYSYIELSKKLGDVKAVRAVASANGANAISILVPCHRIIGSDGSLIGYAGGLTAKKKLLELERIHTGQSIQTRLDL